MNCKHCNSPITSKFCPHCGQPASLKRIDGHYILHELEHILHVERGIFYTIKELITDPGQSVRQYLSEDRSRLVKPVLFIVITSLIYSLTIHFFHIEDRYINFEGDELATPVKIFNWIEAHYGYANILLGVFITMWVKLFFRDHRYNLFELLILLCFVMGMSMLVFSVFALLQGLTKAKLTVLGGVVGLGYCTWAIGHFFGKEKGLNYAKAFLAYLLGLLSFVVTAIVFGFLIDQLISH